MLFKVRPQLRRQISQLMGDLEIIRHPAGFFYRTVEKRLLFCGQARLRIVMQLFPVRLAPNKSPSHQVVPASIASFSVRDIGGITLRKPRNTGAEIIDLRIGAKLNGTRIMARGTSTHADHRPATPRAAVRASKIRLLINKLTR